MYHLYIKYLTVFLLFLINLNVWGQENSSINSWAVQVNFQHQDIIGGTETISIGQLGEIDPVNIRPLFSVEGYRFFGKALRKRKYLNAQLSYFNNTYHDNWVVLKLGFGAERIFWERLLVKYGIELGYGRIKNSDVQYIYETGQWVETTNPDPARFDWMFGPRVDVGYRVTRGSNPIDIFINANLMLHLDTALEGMIPYNALGAGLRYGL